MNTHTHTGARPRRLLVRGAVALVVAAGLGLALTACGDDSDSASPSAPRTASNGDVYNDADVAFATAMVQHHAQAVAMVAMTDGRPLDPHVEKLAEQIRDAQTPEIQTMTGWLTDWGQEIPATVNDHAHGGHDMGDMGDMGGSGGGSGTDVGPETGAGMPGMMSAEQMDELRHASDAEFQDRWLQMMVEHHQGAIDMARDEIDAGRFGDAVALAEHIESSQQEEIDTMREMLG
ncbi:DUF305 domain-containing protein [Nocardioides aquiterrae]|uniref:DUF305 domain-containing protein n=1 Tax=Nocardioides aquiterrae TaxID=203799 RepID=A0ABN1UM73_9ACTN